MAIGDDAAAAGMDLVPSTGATGSAGKVRQGWQEINRTRDYIAQKLAVAKAYTDSKVAAISLSWSSISGKPSTFTPSPHTHTSLDNSSRRFGSGIVDGSVGWDTGENVGVKSGGHLYVFGASAAVSGYTVAYIDATGRVSKGASSERFKEDIEQVDPASLGDIFPDLYEYVMVGDAGRFVRIGHIAERLNESEDLRRFVVYEREHITDEDGTVTGQRLARDAQGNPIPESIDFIALLLAQTAQLHAEVTGLRARIETLESA